jgi:hypothetical protein
MLHCMNSLRLHHILERRSLRIKFLKSSIIWDEIQVTMCSILLLIINNALKFNYTNQKHDDW